MQVLIANHTSNNCSTPGSRYLVVACNFYLVVYANVIIYGIQVFYFKTVKILRGIVANACN